jgi:hypothetical protein
VKKYDSFDLLVMVGACLLFPVLIPVAVGIVVYFSLSAAFSGGTKDEV